MPGNKVILSRAVFSTDQPDWARGKIDHVACAGIGRSVAIEKGSRWHVTDSQSGPAARGAIRIGPVDQVDVVERHLSSLQFDIHGRRLVEKSLLDPLIQNHVGAVFDQVRMEYLFAV